MGTGARERREVTGTAIGRVRAVAGGGAERTARDEFEAAGSGTAQTAPCAGRRYAGATAGDLGGARFDSPAPNFAGDGASISGSRRPVARISWRAEVRRTQRTLMSAAEERTWKHR